MKAKEYQALQLRLSLNLDGADMKALKKYGKVTKGITREVLVPADMNLHALHYVIQKAFGWQNSHLHCFKLPEHKFRKLTANSFMRWVDLCGLYFRFPTDNLDDVYWDDDYNETVSFQSWLRKKYSGKYLYGGYTEHFMEAKSEVYRFCAETEMVRIVPSFGEWLTMDESEREALRKHPRMKKLEDTTCQEMDSFFAEAGSLNELLERLRLSEIMGRAASEKALSKLVYEAEERFAGNTVYAPSENAYRRKMDKLNGTVLPLTNELNYEYDYGDGWQVAIKLVARYSYDETWGSSELVNQDGECIEPELEDRIAEVISRRRPLCIAMDGLPVLDDVGGIHGYCEMLTGIHGEGSQHFDYNDPEETRQWARMLGWTGRMSKPEKLL